MFERRLVGILRFWEGGRVSCVLRWEEGLGEVKVCESFLVLGMGFVVLGGVGCGGLRGGLRRKGVCCSSEVVPSVGDVELVASRKGLKLVDVSKGPLLGMEAWVESERVGYASGYIVPGGKRFHIEALKTKTVKKSRRGALLEPSSANLLVLSLLARAGEKGVRDVYALAIDDEDEQHRRLVRYVKRMGGQEVRKVGGKIGDIKDRLIWGGQGMLLKATLEDVFAKWGPILRREGNLGAPLRGKEGPADDRGED